MRDTIIYMRSPFPFTSGPGVSGVLVRDAKILLDLRIEEIHSIRKHLEAFSGFLDQKKLSEILQGYIVNKESCRGLARFLVGIDERSRATNQNVDDLILSIEKWMGEKDSRLELLSREEFEQLKKRLPLLIEPFQGFSMQAKAERVSQVTGKSLENIQVICDLRPVFDEDRESVQGMIPLTTLKLVCKGVDGFPVDMEAILSRSQVSELHKKAAAAEKKLAQLDKLLSEKKLSVPAIDMTKQD